MTRLARHADITVVHGLAARPAGPHRHPGGVAHPDHADRAGPPGRRPTPAATTSCRPAPTSCWWPRRPAATPPTRSQAMAAGAKVIVEKPLATTWPRPTRWSTPSAAAGARAGLRREPGLRPGRRRRGRPRRRARAAAPPRGAVAAGPTRLGRVPDRPTGAAACCSTSASTRSPSPCCSADAGPTAAIGWCRCGPSSTGADDIEVDEHAEVDLALRQRAGRPGRGQLAATPAAVGPPGRQRHRRGAGRADPPPRPRARRRAAAAARRSRPAADDPQIHQFGYVAQLEDLARPTSPTGGEPEMAPSSAGRCSSIVCAAYASAGQGGAEVALPFTGPRDRTPLQLWRARPSQAADRPVDASRVRPSALRASPARTLAVLIPGRRAKGGSPCANSSRSPSSSATCSSPRPPSWPAWPSWPHWPRPTSSSPSLTRIAAAIRAEDEARDHIARLHAADTLAPLARTAAGPTR